MQRRKFSREFKLEAVRLVKERGVAGVDLLVDLMDAAQHFEQISPNELPRLPGRVDW